MGDLTLYDTLSHTIYIGFNDSCIAGGNIYFGSTGSGISLGYVKLASTKTLGVSGKPFSAGTLLLNHFSQMGSTPQSLTLTGTSTVINLISCVFGADITLTSPYILAKDCQFNGSKTIFTRSGSYSESWDGGNSYAGVMRYTNTSSATVRMQIENADTFSDSVTINSSGTFYGSLAGTTVFYNNLYTTGSSFDFTTGSGADCSYKFAGTTNTLIKGTSTLLFKNLTITKNGTLTLATPITISGTLNLTNGMFNTDTTNLLIFNSGSSWTGTSNQSFVNGPVKKTGNAAFTFPIGKGNSRSVVGISAPASSTDAFMAEYFEGENSLGNTIDTSLQSIARCGYWKIARTNGTSNVSVTLGWDSLPCQNYYDTLIKMGTWDGSKWKKVAIQTVSGNTLYAGRITTSSAVSAFTYFVFANVVAVPVIVDINNSNTGIHKTINDYFGLNVWDIVETDDLSMSKSSFKTVVSICHETLKAKLQLNNLLINVNESVDNFIDSTGFFSNLCITFEVKSVKNATKI